MTDPMARPYWTKVQGVGDWVALADVARRLRPNRESIGNITADMATHIEAEGGTVVRRSQMWWAHKDSLPLLTGFVERSVEGRTRLSGKARGRLLAAIDRDDLAGLPIDEVFARIARDEEAFNEALRAAMGDDE